MSGRDYSGQWTGYSVGTPSGRVIADLDHIEASSVGHAYLFSEDSKLPSVVATISLPDSKKRIEIEAQIKPFDARFGHVLNPADLQKFFPEAKLSENANLIFERTGSDSAKITWHTEIGTVGEVVLTRSRLPESSTVTADPHVKSWKDFRERASEMTFRDYLFRGQSKPYPLQTSFHRTARKLLTRFLNEDIQVAHRSLTGKTKHLFDLSKPQELGAFLNLIQHHGFPTPLLDWTYSPFVAAWFAFFGAAQRGNGNEPVRVFCIDRNVMLKFNQFQHLTFVPPHFSILETLAIENDRAIPQQGVLTLTNLHDIESHIRQLESQNRCRLLSAFDLPYEDTSDALNDLAMMGITRSTMFPGIESICLDLRDRMFS